MEITIISYIMERIIIFHITGQQLLFYNRNQNHPSHNRNYSRPLYNKMTITLSIKCIETCNKNISFNSSKKDNRKINFEKII